MQLEHIKKDRSGISTMVAVVAVVIVVIIAAAAAYVLLSDDKEEEKTLAPGSYFHYDITRNGESVYAESTIIGQNATDYFFASEETYSDGGTLFYYSLFQSPFFIPDHAERTGTEEMETIDGIKTLEIWEYEEEYDEITHIKEYYDPSADIVYKSELSGDSGYEELQILVEYELVWQTSYEESADLYKEYEYSAIKDGLSISAYITCMADCINDEYGMLYEFLELQYGIYMLSECPMGLPVDAVDTGETVVLTDTIDGDVTVEKWTLTFDEKDWTFYAEPDTHVIYQFDTTIDGTAYTFILDNKPE